MKIEPVKPFVVVLYISDEESDSYGHPWYNLVKSVSKDCDYLDIDQNSEKSLLNNIKTAVVEARPFILMVDVINFTETPPGLGTIADAMLRQSKHCYAILKGDHQIIRKWLSPLGGHFILYKDEEELQEQLKKILHLDSQESD